MGEDPKAEKQIPFGNDKEGGIGLGTEDTILRPRLGLAAVKAHGMCVRRHFWGLSSGKRMTSRMDLELVRIMVRRSMPMPSPPVGGRP